MNAAGNSAPWYEELRQAVADAAGPDAAARFQRNAENVYNLYTEAWGGAWGQHAVRQAAKSVLADIATTADPEVEAARERAAKNPASGPGQGTPDGETDDTARHETGKFQQEYAEVAKAAYRRHSDEVQQAWSELDTAFVNAHRGELEAAWPEGFAAAFGSLGAGAGHGGLPADFGLIWTATAGFPATAQAQPSSRPDREVRRYARRSTRPRDPGGLHDAAWLAALSFPGPVRTPPIGQSGCAGSAAPPSRTASTANDGQQARRRRSR